jgi:hypothetical protein
MKACIFLFCVMVSSACGQVSFERILRADKEPQNWLTYSETNWSQRYSRLNQITTEMSKIWNSSDLPGLVTRKFEVTALSSTAFYTQSGSQRYHRVGRRYR